ncbi:hypothetical protein AC629_27695 [Bradyrhizobium sp. NAS80.1]|nr:hypothetical protein AC630_40175 [Bradyrhizobium sp. AS23.2]OKO80299.1 hypothetical protein AC629_27695 [Bradyrhizobium sp. NAS80.1]
MRNPPDIACDVADTTLAVAIRHIGDLHNELRAIGNCSFERAIGIPDVKVECRAIAQQSDLGFHLREEAIPVKPGVAAACELLGLDPLHVANEGKLVAIVAPENAAAVLAAMRAHPLVSDAADIGEALADDHHFVQMATSFGGGRIVDWLSGEQLPRIC